MIRKDILSQILFEAKSYKTFEGIEKLVDVGTDLSMIPIQPLYISLMGTSTDQIAQILPKLSRAQRQSLLDLDLWRKDVVDVNSFEHWIEVYSKVEDHDLTQEFVTSEDFYLYLKSRVNIHTFDTEEPEYPDHDYYFLTDDMLLLIEYSEEYTYPNELKYLVRMIYSKFGVEVAYTTLFKLINDNFSELQEQRYQIKKDRLRDFGFVDYYEAIEKLHPFASFKQIDNFINKKIQVTANIDLTAQNQSLHSSALVSFDSDMENILKELAKVKDEGRLNYLHFTFIRMVNSTITINDALKGGRIELTRIGKHTRNTMELGLQYVKMKSLESGDKSLFTRFDFFDLYKVGHTLIMLLKNKVKKSLVKTPFESEDFEYFLGAWWNSFLDNSELDIPKVKAYGAALHASEVNNLTVYEYWKKDVTLFTESLPFINSFFTMFQKLKADGKLHDEFYLNYEVENIDFESIIISSYINFSLGYFSGTDVNKMGVSISELREFFKEYFIRNDSDGEYFLIPFDNVKMKNSLSEFIEKFGFSSINNFGEYFYGILSEHLSGYDFDTLGDEDFKHIGGPILLNSIPNN